MGVGDTLLQAYQRDPDFDPHSRLASQILKITYEEGMDLKAAKDKHFKNTRQQSKAASFGYPGGMGASTFIEYAKAYGLALTLEEATALKAAWRKSVPEVPKYFKWVSKLCAHGYATVSQIRSGRVRGGCSYTDLANTMWSGLAADGVKLAAFNIAKACYVEVNSPLYGSRPVVVIHDEFILETPAQKAAAAGPELSRIMEKSMEEYTPNIPSRASAVIMRRWYKDADPAFDAAGLLIPWEPSS
jgi:DNA polymerase I-like protein with 3'-5' exonuclease and polymerase domains